MSVSSINEFINRAIQSGGWTSLDRVFLINRLKTLIGDFDETELVEETIEKSSVDMLQDLLEIAEENGKFNSSNLNRQQLGVELMEFLTPPTSVVNALFSQHYDNSEKEATNYYYHLNQENGYIDEKMNERKEIMVNDSHMILQKKEATSFISNQCSCCFDSEGEGLGKNRIKRIIRMNLKGESWGFFYEGAPLITEHSIFSPENHESIDLTRASQTNMLRLLDIYPHYFISYDPLKNQLKDHGFFFGGRKNLPLIESKDGFDFDIPGFVTVKCSLVRWPLSVIRLKTPSKKNLINSIEYLNLKWQQYSYPSLDIRATSEKGKNLHSLIPIFRKEDENYIAELILIDNSEAFKKTHDYTNILYDKNSIIDKFGIITIKSDLDFNERLYSIIKDNFLQQEIFKKTSEGKSAFIRFIDTL